MATHQVDRVLEHMDTAMGQLRRSMRGMPVRQQGFKGEHDEAARAVARLTVALSDCRHTIR
ncbi:hypothetical protein [Amycolatopsis cihanbeyliensis]|uniref:Uncharacterized protein n=1 Tax=Amycolatopsis cihanbeyliensis TaxID=1128664 RepID=A0A542DQS2_AMYCI|nr:hypothetical protein [Amycolatopsis cihanbeyliensis]TQJ05450.1 hypothetical protein FB471_5281 [Amycolatopsis cihanbeyliensis]